MAHSGSDAAPISTHPTEEEDVMVERTPEEEVARLRYLEFVQQAAAQALVLAAAACAYAKQGAGLLRPVVDHIEGTVKAIVGPVYDRYHAMPLDLLKFLDSKIKDTSVLVRLRPAWEDLQSYLIARGRKCFEVYVCTMVERDYALEMWRLLDPDSRLVNYVQLSDRMVCVKSGK